MFPIEFLASGLGAWDSMWLGYWEEEGHETPEITTLGVVL